jgi:hypothetical protein
LKSSFRWWTYHKDENPSPQKGASLRGEHRVFRIRRISASKIAGKLRGLPFKSNSAQALSVLRQCRKHRGAD